MRLRNRLILALDVPDAGRARGIADAVRGHVDAIKVNWPLVMSGGMPLVKELSALGYVLFAEALDAGQVAGALLVVIGIAWLERS